MQIDAKKRVTSVGVAEKHVAWCIFRQAAPERVRRSIVWSKFSRGASKPGHLPIYTRWSLYLV